MTRLLLCERRAKPCLRPNDLTALRFLNRCAPRAPRADRQVPGGIFCRGIYRGLTITAQLKGIRGPTTLGWDIQRCAFTDRTERHRPRRPAAARRSAGGAFTVGEQETPRNAAAAGSLRAISTVDALIALQGVEDPRERKKRALAKGRSALDVLDTLKLSLLDGSIDRSTLARLKVAAEGLAEATGDPGTRCRARSACAWR
jgi:hypothetical protein